jgi:hypothetical protein
MSDNLGPILGSLGRIEGELATLSKKVEGFCVFRDTTLEVLQSFRDYKEARKDLPEKIERVGSELQNHITETKDDHNHIMFLMRHYWAIFGAVILLQLILTGLVLFGKYIGIVYGIYQ